MFLCARVCIYNGLLFLARRDLSIAMQLLHGHGDNEVDNYILPFENTVYSAALRRIRKFVN